MRISQLTAALILIAACDNAYDPDAPAIDPTAPKVHITSPERGTFAGAVGSVEVRGNAVDDSAITSVAVTRIRARPAIPARCTTKARDTLQSHRCRMQGVPCKSHGSARSTQRM